MTQLDAVRMDVLREIGNIGLGNAMSALSELTAKNFSISVPVACPLEFEEVPGLFGDAERIVVGASLAVSGECGGNAAFLFSWDSARILWQALIQSAPESYEQCEEIHTSVIAEISNIMLGAYMKALSEMTGITFILHPPDVVTDMSAAILSTLTLEAVDLELELIAIQTHFEAQALNFEGFFLFLPKAGGMDRLFSVLGVA